MTINDVHAEYGVSEEAFIDVGVFLNDREITARGSSLEEAMANLAGAIEYRRDMDIRCEDFKRQFDACIKSAFGRFRTPIIGGVNG